MAKLPRFVFFLPTTKDNGGNQVALALARALVQKSVNVTVVTSDYHGKSALLDPRNNGIQFDYAPSLFSSKLLAFAMFYLWASLYGLLSNGVFVNTHLVTVLIPRRWGNRAVWLMQDIDYRFFEQSAKRWLKRLYGLVRGSKIPVITTSLWLGIFAQKTRLNLVSSSDIGIDEAYQSMRCNQPRDIDFLMIARLGAHKRYEETISAAKHLAQRGYKVKLINHGARLRCGDHPSLLESSAVSATEMARLFERSKAFICLSRVEGYGLPVLEALASGCNVYATPMPSIRSIRYQSLRVLRRDEISSERLLAIVAEEMVQNSCADNICTMQAWAKSTTNNLMLYLGWQKDE